MSPMIGARQRAPLTIGQGAERVEDPGADVSGGPSSVPTVAKTTDSTRIRARELHVLVACRLDRAAANPSVNRTIYMIVA